MKKKIFIVILGIFIASAISVSAYTFTETIRYGTTSSADVYKLQEKLINEGYLNGTPNGSVYSTTSNSIKKFQKANGLTPDGIVGPKTRNVLNKNIASVSPTNPVTDHLVNQMPPMLKTLTDELWQPLCNGSSITECIDPIIGYSQLPREGQWLIWAEQGTFDDSISKTLETKVANCADDESCSLSHEYKTIHVCRYSQLYIDEPCS